MFVDGTASKQSTVPVTVLVAVVVAVVVVAVVVVVIILVVFIRRRCRRLVKTGSFHPVIHIYRISDESPTRRVTKVSKCQSPV